MEEALRASFEVLTLLLKDISVGFSAIGIVALRTKGSYSEVSLHRSYPLTHSGLLAFARTLTRSRRRMCGLGRTSFLGLPRT